MAEPHGALDERNESVRYVTDKEGKRVGVILDIEEYGRIMDDLEELEDIREGEEVLDAIEQGEEETSTLEEALPRIEAERERLRQEGKLV